VRLWSLDGRLIAEFDHLKYVKKKARWEDDTSIFFAVFSPDSQRLLTVSGDNSVILWDLHGKWLNRFNHSAAISSALFSPDGTRILTASADNTVKLWDTQGNLLSVFDKHRGDVHGAIFSPDGQQVLSMSADKTVQFWYTPAGIIKWLQTAQIPPLTEGK
jgi:WD40 repeat protein